MCHGVARRVRRDTVVFACAPEFIEFFPERHRLKSSAGLFRGRGYPAARRLNKRLALCGRYLPREVRFACHAAGKPARVTGPDVTEQDSAGRDQAVPAGPLAGEPRERALDLPRARRVGSWLIWWVLMMSFWVILDDSIATDELLAGAGAAALAALLAELVTYQAASRFRMRISWLVPALRLPGEVAVDMVIVYAALWRRLEIGRAHV